ncbi:VOC family protein [Euzebya tangerina]|uniref:VOC family protein n=1 Tax=Euzebya tangerina TaxID=591198 RepID=UPI0013C3060D|nr:VOC family protein [Euzebya tangerina]
MPQVIASLTYDDVDAAITWLCDTFGFRERVSARVAHEGVTYHAEIEVGERGLIMLGPPFSDRSSPRTHGGTTLMLVAYVDDIQAHFARTREAGATIMAEIEDTFYGDLTYRASDVEGHHWMFSQRVKDIPPEEWDWAPGS